MQDTKNDLRLDPNILAAVRDQNGVSLAEWNEASPVLLVFLRHAGCTFCREAMADLARDREAIESKGARIAIAHMLPEQQAKAFAAKYGLGGIPRFSDPEKALYEHFGLKRGKLGQLFGLKSFTRGFKAGIVDGHGIGTIGGDPLQMPGAFLVFRNAIVAAYRHESAADRPDYAAMADCCPVPLPAGGAK